MSQQSHCTWRKTPKGEQLPARTVSFLQDTTHAPSGCTASLTSSWSTWAEAKPHCGWQRQCRAALCPESSWAQRCPSAAGSTLTRLRCCSATRTWALSWKSSGTVKSWIAWRWVRSQEVSQHSWKHFELSHAAFQGKALPAIFTMSRFVPEMVWTCLSWNVFFLSFHFSQDSGMVWAGRDPKAHCVPMHWHGMQLTGLLRGPCSPVPGEQLGTEVPFRPWGFGVVQVCQAHLGVQPGVCEPAHGSGSRNLPDPCGWGTLA